MVLRLLDGTSTTRRTGCRSRGRTGIPAPPSSSSPREALGTGGRPGSS